jgi:hypothetical protein
VDALVIVWAEVEVCLVRIWSDGLVCLAWDMLYVVLVEGRLLNVVLGGFGWWWRHNDRIGNMMEVVLGSLLGAPILSAMMGTNGNMVVMLVAASEWYG